MSVHANEFTPAGKQWFAPPSHILEAMEPPHTGCGGHLRVLSLGRQSHYRAPFLWRYDLGGYYDYLARGFAAGHLYVPLEPSPVLLGMANPWDPAINDAYKMQDMALYRRHYYLYFGVAPAVLLFWPWRLATGHDLPESFALFLLCLAGFLFSSAKLLRLLDLANARPGGLVLALLVFALGICQSVPYLLNRPAVYEIAIASGYCFLSVAIFCLAYGAQSGRPALCLVVFGVLFGLAMASRPHLSLAALVAALFLGSLRRFSSHRMIAFGLAFAAICAAVGIYNQQRFGNAFEFGFRYQLSGPGQNQIDLAARNLIPGFYFMLLRPPDFSPVFPWMHLVFRHSYEVLEKLPRRYFYEPTAGALWTAPFLLGVVFLPRKQRILAAIAVSAAAILLFLATTHLMTQRYAVDFLPLGLLASLAGIVIYRDRASRRVRRLITVLMVLAIGYSSIANLALGFAGPYDDLLRNRPASYVRIARWFSPFPQTRPLLNPEIQLVFRVHFANQQSGFRKPLVTLGGVHHGWSLSVQHLLRGPQLISQTEQSQSHFDILARDPLSATFRITWSRRTRIMQVVLDGQTVITEPLATLVTAPAQVLIGSGFTSPIEVQGKSVWEALD
ncbi:MAG TPA: hypothetical protein VH640_10435 [Bryobacteraceae bacterium]